MTRQIWVLLGVLALPTPSQSCYTPVLSGLNRTGIEYVRIEIDPSAAQMVAGGAASIVNGFDNPHHGCVFRRGGAGIGLESRRELRSSLFDDTGSSTGSPSLAAR